jgi:transketolase
MVNSVPGVNEIESAARQMRLAILRLVHAAGNKGAHVASPLSMVEIMASLLLGAMGRDDIFILSKGHGGLCYYAALKEAGRISGEQLDTFERDGGDFPGQPVKHLENGIVYSGGSLGMGLPYACGLALASKRKKEHKRIYVLLGDGELNEGSNWEAAMFARHQGLDNLTAVIDHNGMQSDGAAREILDVDWQALFRAHGWRVSLCDGHAADSLLGALTIREEDGKPKAVIAETIKGKGVSFIENNAIWHHSRLTKEQYNDAVREVLSHDI